MMGRVIFICIIFSGVSNYSYSQTCSISSLTANFLPCNDNGTSQLDDDTFIADFTIQFTNPPTTGNIELEVRGQTFSTSVVGLGTQFQFLSIPLTADGLSVEATARFTAIPGCSLTTVVGTAPGPCSCSVDNLTANFLPCNGNGTSQPDDDTFIADFTIQFTDPPTTGNIELEVRGQTFSTSVVGLGTQFQFLSIPLIADGQPVEATARFTDIPGCSLTTVVGTAPGPCSCSINNLTANFLPCNDNGTSQPDDDTFIADFTIQFTDPPTTGNIELEVQGQTFSTSVVGLGTQFQFLAIPLIADGLPVEATARFTAISDCSLTTVVGTAPDPCSPICSIDNLTANFLPCNGNGTSQPDDDTFIADFTIQFTNPPTTGNIELEVQGQTFSTSVVGLGTQFQFLSIPLTADGQPVEATTRFTAISDCSLTTIVGTAPESCSPTCIIDNISANFLSCEANGTYNPTDDYLLVDFTVTTINSPTIGDVVLEVEGQFYLNPSPGGDADVIFSNIPVLDVKSNVTATASFTAIPTCSLTQNVGMSGIACPIPTLTQWGVIILLLSFITIAAITLRQENIIECAK